MMGSTIYCGGGGLLARGFRPEQLHNGRAALNETDRTDRPNTSHNPDSQNRRRFFRLRASIHLPTSRQQQMFPPYMFGRSWNSNALPSATAAAARGPTVIPHMAAQ